MSRPILCATPPLLAALLLAGTPAWAQEPDPRPKPFLTASATFPPAARAVDPAPARPAASFPPLPRYGAWVGVTKWATLTAAAGLGTLGAVLHQDADKVFGQLERRCEADPALCQARRPDGSYEDPALEALYQDVRDKDRKARLSFVAAQVSFGVSVLLFIVDFQKKKGPGDVPYDPERSSQASPSPLRLSVTPGELALRYYFR